MAASAALYLRLCSVSVFVLLVVWVQFLLGGLGLSPTVTKRSEDGAVTANDTGVVFNWHPLCMSLAFVVLMSEGVIAYRAPTGALKEERKRFHFIVHTIAIVAVTFGLIAAFQSHNLALPTPKPNLYSAHSWVGILVSISAYLQYCAGFYAFWWPKLALGHRKQLMPLHVFLGSVTYCGSLGALLMGLQEKATFIQGFGGAQPFAAILTLPALTAVLVVCTGGAVLLTMMHCPKANEQEARYAATSDSSPLVARNEN